MARSNRGPQRVRRLAFAGLLWAAFVGFQALPVPGRTGTRDEVRFERGRLPVPAETIAETRNEPRLEQAAAILAGRGTTVRCWSPSDWKAGQARLMRSPEDRLGAWRAYTLGSPSQIHLSPEVCAQLAKLRRRPIRSDDSVDALAWSVSALAHEAQHVAGISSEAKAECYGVQSIEQAARLLGRTQREGRYLATVYWRHWYVWLEPPYYSSECRNGGGLDLYPAWDRWP